jgi:hypothetical protein
MATPGPIPQTTASLPSPPFVTMQGIANFRDLGGYAIASDPKKSVRMNYIFRCAEPTSATEQDITKINTELKVTHIYDLRSNPEIEKLQVSGGKGKVVNWPGVERVYCPVFPETSYDPVSLAIRHADFHRGDIVVRFDSIFGMDGNRFTNERLRE